MFAVQEIRRSLCGLGLAATLGALLLTACGGGGSAGTAAPTAKSSYALGRISGFGSVVINGVHYQEGTASVTDEDGEMRKQDDLKLGMVVEVKADEIGQSNNVKTATAQNITFSSLIRGPIESIGTDTLVVLGQTVKLTNMTVFDERLVGGAAALKVGAVVRVYGTAEPTTGVYTATRIEPQDGAELYRLRGAVAAYDAGKTLRIGNALIDVSGVTVPDGLKVGSLVRVKLQTAQVKGAWVAVSVKLGLFEPQNNDHTEVEGVITDFTSSAAFSVNGLPVDASKASFPDGTTKIVKGARVEVEGAIVNGTLVATKVGLKTDEEDEHDGFDVDGVISAVDAVKLSFVVRGVTVNYAGTVTFVGGTAADLKKDAKVEVHGTLSADHTLLTATRIEFKH